MPFYSSKKAIFQGRTLLEFHFVCILCMHLAVCVFFTPITALMHLQNSLPNASSCIFFLLTHAHGISLKIIIKDSIIRQILQTQIHNIKSSFILCYFDTVVYSKYQRINMSM